MRSAGKPLQRSDKAALPHPQDRRCTVFARLSPSTARAAVGQARAAAQDPNDPAAPAGLVTVGALTFWPYTGDDFTGAPKDPINAIFTGTAITLQIRAALRRPAGNRSASGLPTIPTFTCTWQ